jgi:paraquat-inducible protein B
MADNETELTSEIPDAELKKKSSGISAVWVIPIIAALIGGWLVFQNATEEKAIAEVTFKSASGLEAGKTIVKLRNIKVGEVKDVKFSDDLSEVVVVMEFEGVQQDRLTDTTRFWVVKPRVGLEGVSGLETLLSGAYIEVDPGEGGQPTTQFTGLEEPDIYQLGNPGTRYTLITNELGSISIGSPVKFRDIEVGTVTRYKLVEDHSHVEVEIFVRAPHDKYVKQKTRFWNVSGVDIKIGAEGVELGLDSMASLLAGGVAFSTENDSEAVPQATEKTAFKLYNTEEPEIEEVLAFSAPMKLYFDNGVSGLSIGAPVEFKGLRLGTVVDIGVEVNVDRANMLTFAKIDIEPDRLPIHGDIKHYTNEQRMRAVYQFLESLVNNGLRAQLTSGNLLTGQSLVALDIFPGAEKARLKYVDGLPILPTVPETLSGLMDQFEKVTARLEAMPIEKISLNLAETTESVNDLINSFNVAEGGMMGVQVHGIMEEITRAARSIRSISEYLERHPEALIKGKSAE